MIHFIWDGGHGHVSGAGLCATLCGLSPIPASPLAARRIQCSSNWVPAGKPPFAGVIRKYPADGIPSRVRLWKGPTVGLSVARKEHLGIFCEARLGFNLYDDATMQGFYNDMFSDYVYVSLRAGVCILF